MLTKNIVGIALVKNTLRVCHVSIHGELLSNKAMSRQIVKELLAKIKPPVNLKRE